MIIGFTGTQNGMTNFQKATVKEILLIEKCDHFVHGDCVGADYEANNLASEFIRYITIFPPDNPRKRAWCFNHQRIDVMKWEWLEYKRPITNKLEFDFSLESQVTYQINMVRWAPRAPYLQRNQLIVDNCEMMIACPKESSHTVRSGTWATVRYAWKVKRKIVIVPPINRDE